jgi:hypothetical protein
MKLTLLTALQLTMALSHLLPAQATTPTYRGEEYEYFDGLESVGLFTDPETSLNLGYDACNKMEVSQMSYREYGIYVLGISDQMGISDLDGDGVVEKAEVNGIINTYSTIAAFARLNLCSAGTN